MKKIKQEEINAVLQTVYGTNIPAQTFDALKKFFDELPKLDEEPKDVGK
jgi:hypothetical protein